ncbi:MAG TPA: phosphatidate cytidylyltransferase, partial [Flavitalea sp.]|nr:phosphatidate cytidylyltransferase [Flavitalea sp.]
MALNTATFKTRTLSAILFAGIMLAGILWNKWSFFLLFSVIHAGCWIEYQKLIEIIHPAYRRISALHRYAFIAAGWIMMWIFVVEQVSPSPNLQLYLITLIAVLLLFALVADVWQSTFRWPVYFYSVAGLIYISLSWSLMIDLRFKGILRFGEQQVDLGWVVPLVLITAIWINDTMAYIVGSLIGKTPFSSISPNKTWEGTAGGALLAVVVVTGCWYAFVTPASWKEIACI